MKLIEEARKYEQEGRWDHSRFKYFFHHLQFAVAVTDMALSCTHLRPEAVKAADYLQAIFMLLREETKRQGKSRCWQFRQRRYRLFVFKLALLVGRLKETARLVKRSKM